MIAYTPVDISCKVPDHDLLVDYIEKNYITNLEQTYGYTSKLCSIASNNVILDWRDANQIFADYAGDKLYFAPGVADMFPELLDILYSLPYKKIIGMGLSLHTNSLESHRDSILNFGSYSPERYNVLLSPHYEQDSFFICKEKHGEKTYPKILKEYPIYAFNNNETYHGADLVLDKRVILICVGILDEKKHIELINQSAEKFKEYVIRY
jgi:hypothetical protein